MQSWSNLQGAQNSWVTSLYLSNQVEKQLVFDFPSFYEALGEAIKSRIPEYRVEEEPTKAGRKISMIPSNRFKDAFYWRLVLFQLRDEQHYYVALTIRPEKYPRIKKQLSRNEALQMVEEFLGIVEKIGKEIQVIYKCQTILLKRFSYTQERMLDASGWKVWLSDTQSMRLEDYIENGIGYVKRSFREGNIKFRVVNKLTLQILYQPIVDLLKRYGEVEELPSDYERVVPDLGKDLRAVYVVLCEKGNEQDYFKTKEFFMGQGVPCQHVSENILSNSYSENNFICEVAMKSGVVRFFLDPSELGQIDGFICIGDIYNWNTQKRLLEVLYIFSSDKERSNEKLLLFDQSEVQFDVKKYKISFQDPQNFAHRIAYPVTKGLRLCLIFTKRPNPRNVNEIVDALRAQDITVNRAYYIPTRWLRFVDEFIKQPSGACSHPYLILSNKVAVIKLPTKLSIYPQLFSSAIELIYPYDAKIDVDDLKKIVWLVKKRLYRYHQVSMVSSPEPVAIWRSNKKFLLDTQHKNINLRLLI